MNSVTVLITCFNEGELLLRAYDSLLNQTDKEYHILVVNDASTHHITNQCCKLLEKKGVTIIWRKNNGGLSAARNTGFSASVSDVIVPLDADDTLPENAIELIKKEFETEPEVDFVFGNYNRINGIDEKLISCNAITNQLGYISIEKVLKNWILIGTSPCRKSLWKKLGGYSLEFTNTLQDMNFWIKAFERDVKGKFINKPIYNWHVSESGMNASVKSFDLNLIRFRHRDIFLNFSVISKKELARSCFLSFYGMGRTKLVKELFLSMPFNLSAKNTLVSFLCLLFPSFMQTRIEKLNKNRTLY